MEVSFQSPLAQVEPVLAELSRCLWARVVLEQAGMYLSLQVLRLLLHWRALAVL